MARRSGVCWVLASKQTNKANHRAWIHVGHVDLIDKFVSKSLNKIFHGFQAYPWARE